jgi:hypothetical protein
MAIATYTALNSPLVTQQEIIDALRLTVPSQWNIPIYDEFPSDIAAVRFGLYVSNVITSERTVNQLGVQYCGAIYNANDTVTINYVSFQQDPYEAQVCSIIGDLVTNNIDGVQLMDGYFQRTYNQELTYGPTRAAIHTWTFSLTRLEFNT